ncbi:MAG: hypothetical protein AAF394_00075 [Planctomycetota bacterium]
MSRLKQLRDDVRGAVATLTAITARNITPVAAWSPPERSVEEVDAGGEVWVVPSKRESEIISRGSSDETKTIDVAIFEQLGDEPDETVERNQVLADAILDSMLGSKAGAQRCIGGEQPMPFDVEKYREKRLFVTVIQLRYR